MLQLLGHEQTVLQLSGHEQTVLQLSGHEQTVLQLSGHEQTVLQLLDKSVLQLCVTALFYLENSKKIHPRGVRACRPKDVKRRTLQHIGERERETPGPLAPLFISLFLAPGPALCKSGQPGVLFVPPEVLIQILGPSFVPFSRAFPFLVFQPPPFWIPVSYSNYLTGGISGKLDIEGKISDVATEAIQN